MAIYPMWWKEAKRIYEMELEERKSFNRTYLRLQEYDYEPEFAKEYIPRLDYWRPYLNNAINYFLGQPYALSEYSDEELEKIVSQLDEAITRSEKENK